MIQPFAAAVVGLVGVLWFVLQTVRAHSLQRPLLVRLLVFSVTAVPIIGYLIWLMRANPHFQQWMSQNVTPSPPMWQWLVGYGLLVPLAAAGAWRAAQRRSEADRLLLVWLGIHLLAMLSPIDLQRRLSTGLHLPLALLAAIGVWEVVLPHVRRTARRWATFGLLVLVFPSNLLVMLAGVGAVASGNPYLVISDDQREALKWLQYHAAPDSVVLTDIEFGTLVPGWGGGARVVYGHPFETLDAATLEPKVDAFFSGGMTAVERTGLLESQSVDLVVIQSDRFSVPNLPDYQLAWKNDAIEIFQRKDP
jgi:hypothetical protein